MSYLAMSAAPIDNDNNQYETPINKKRQNNNKTQIGALISKENLGPREIEDPRRTIIEKPGRTNATTIF